MEPILTIPIGTRGFMIYSDDSGVGLGSVLMYFRKVVPYDVRQLKEHENNYATHDFELVALILVLILWRHLYGMKF